MAVTLERTKLVFCSITARPDIEDLPPDELPVMVLAAGDDRLTDLPWSVVTRSPLSDADLRAVAQADLDNPTGWGNIIYAVVTADGGPGQAIEIRCAREMDATQLAAVVQGEVRHLGPADPRQAGLFAA